MNRPKVQTFVVFRCIEEREVFVWEVLGQFVSATQQTFRVGDDEKTKEVMECVPLGSQRFHELYDDLPEKRKRSLHNHLNPLVYEAMNSEQQTCLFSEAEVVDVSDFRIRHEEAPAVSLEDHDPSGQLELFPVEKRSSHWE